MSFAATHLIGFGAAVPASSSFSPTDLGAKLRAWWDYTDTANLWQNTDATGAVSADTDPVGRVSDKSGNGKHLIQANGANKPAYRTGPARVVYDGSNDYLACAAAAFPIDEFELFQVASTAGGDSGRFYTFAPSSGNDYQSQGSMLTAANSASQLFAAYAFNGSLNPIQAGTGGTPFGLQDVVKTASTCQLNVNGTQVATDNSFTALTSPHNGAFYDACAFLAGAPATSECLNVTRYETIMTAALTSDERAAVRNYMYAKHGITP